MNTFSNFVCYLRHRHPMLVRLISLNVAVSVAVWVIMLAGLVCGFPTDFIETFLSLPAVPEILISHCWTIVTYMITHYSPLHLLFNMLWLYWFAVLFESLTSRRLFCIYAGGGLAGAIFFIVGMNMFYSGSVFRLCGASASVMALLASAVVVAPNKEIRLMLFGDVKLKWLALVAIILAIAGLGGGNTGGQFAHFGGMVFGVIYGFAVLRNEKRSRVIKPKATKGSAVKRELRSPDPENARRLAETIAESGNKPLADPERLDQLLDKIRVSGYGSLSYSERSELMAISSRLDADNRPPVQ